MTANIKNRTNPYFLIIPIAAPAPPGHGSMRRTVYQLATRAPGSRLKANQISDFRNFVSASFAPLELLEAPRLPRGFGLKRLAEPKDAMSAFGKMSSDLRRRGLGNHVDLRGLLGGAEG